MNTTKLIVSTVIAVLVLIGLLTTFETVDAGSVKVVKRWGAVTGRVLEPGVHMLIPLVDDTIKVNTKALIYETMKEKDLEISDSDYKQTAVDTNTSDGQRIDLFYTIRFSIDPTRATDVVNKFGSESLMVDKIVRAESRSHARIIPSNFGATELYVGEGKEKVASLLFEKLDPIFKDNGIILDSVLVREFEFTPEYRETIERKQLEAVKVETEEHIAEQAKHKAQAEIEMAKAEAEKQKLQAQTITRTFLEKEWIDAWRDGGAQVPKVIMGNDTPFLLNLAELAN